MGIHYSRNGEHYILKKIYLCDQNFHPMNFTFFHRPEVRKYNYKPQFYVPEDEKPINYDKYDNEKFAKKLHKNWDSKRRVKNNSTSNMRTIFWLVFFIFALGVMAWFFFVKLNL
jgi:hypothetical protein